MRPLQLAPARGSGRQDGEGEGDPPPPPIRALLGQVRGGVALAVQGRGLGSVGRGAVSRGVALPLSVGSGITHFDNIWYAMLQIFVVITLEGWAEIM